MSGRMTLAGKRALDRERAYEAFCAYDVNDMTYCDWLDARDAADEEQMEVVEQRLQREFAASVAIANAWGF